MNDLSFLTEFDIRPVVINGLNCRLVVPSKEKHKWAPEEVGYRSVILDENNKIISRGFPKFFNFHEKPALHEEIIAAFNSGRAYISPKLDGSLLIRDVINGQVHWRTRGYHAIHEDMPVAEINKLISKYPVLSDITFATACSLLFEYTSPANKIVVGYGHPKLTLIGQVQHDNGYLKPLPGVQELALRVGLDSIFCHPPTTDWATWYNEIKSSTEDIEGAVIGWYDQHHFLHLVKIKTDLYFIRHAAITKMTETKILELLAVSPCHNLTAFIEMMAEYHFDEESIHIATPWFKDYLTRFHQAANRVARYQRLLAENNIIDPKSKTDIQKVVALKFEDNALAFQILKNNHSWVERYIHSCATLVPINNALLTQRT